MVCVLHNCIIIGSHFHHQDDLWITKRRGKKKTKMKSTYSHWEDNEDGLPHGSMLVPLLFNIFICNLFTMLLNMYFASYNHVDSTQKLQNNISQVGKSLEEVWKPLVKWFKHSQRDINPHKCHLTLSDSYGKTTDQQKFQSHIENLRSKANGKLHALAPLAPYNEFFFSFAV